MSWGWFAELRCTVATAAWKGVLAKKPVEIALAPGWSGLSESWLEEAFGTPNTRDQSFAEVLAWYRGPETIKSIERKKARTEVRIALLLDKSLLDMAFPLATLLHAVGEAGGSGSLRLLNDGTSEGEEGVELTLKSGKITRAKIEGWSAMEELGMEIFQPAPGKTVINPFTGQPVMTKPKKRKRPRK